MYEVITIGISDDHRVGKDMLVGPSSEQCVCLS